MDNPIEASLSILPHEKLIEILLALDSLEDITNACRSSTIFARVCQDDYFWKLRYRQDFGSGRPTEEMFQEKIPLEPYITTGDSMSLKPYITSGDSMPLKPYITSSDSMPWRDFYQSTIEMLHFPPLSVGYNHTGVIDRKGQLNMWGYNESGQLGNGTEISTNDPQIVLHNVRQVSCSHGMTGAVTKDGKVYTWGSNYKGSLGIGSYEDDNVLVPTLVKLPSQSDGVLSKPKDFEELEKKVRKIDYSSGSSIILTEGGEVYMWGELTHYLYTEVPLKLNLPLKEKVIDVATGDKIFAAITKSGKLYMWGDSRHYLYLSKNWTNMPSGIYNLDNPDHRKLVQPTLVSFSEPIRQISMSDKNFGVVTKKGELWMAGDNFSNQIGEHTSIGKDVDKYKKIINISTKNGIGLMGGLDESIPVLTLIKIPSPILFFNSRWDTSLVKLKDGRVLMWGNNRSRQIYPVKHHSKINIELHGEYGIRVLKPTEIGLDHPIVYIMSGAHFTAAITSDDYVNLWGTNLALSDLQLN